MACYARPMTKAIPHLTLVLGGVASGKSAHAEALALKARRSLLYIATAEAHDSDMRAKIDVHIARRGPEWRTLEAPLSTAEALIEAPAGQIILLDCLTMWLSNHLFAEHDLTAETDKLLGAITRCKSPIIAVSNELGLGGIGADSLTRRFQREQGQLNQRIAARAELVHFVTAGITQTLKGTS